MTLEYVATIGVPKAVAECLAQLVAALGGPVTLIGGWAVTTRLRMARSRGRPTEDIDIVVGEHLRPAAAALAAIDAVQDDPEHPCRLAGLPVLVDLLAEAPSGSLVAAHVADRSVTDADGLELLVPPFARLLCATAEHVRLEADDHPGVSAVIALPRAGALLAAKMANLDLEDRLPEKKAGDGEDAVRLLNTFGALALAEDLLAATEDERRRLRYLLDATGAGGLLAAVGTSDVERDEARIGAALKTLADALN